MHRLAPWLALTLSLLLLMFAAIELVQRQWQEELAAQRRTAGRELNQLASVVRNDLQIGNYQHVGDLMDMWGRNNDRIEAMQLTTGNGFMLNEYKRPTPSDHPFRISTTIDYSYRGEAQLTIIKDLDGVYQRRKELAWQMVTLYAVVALLLTGLTKAFLKYRHKSVELEHEIERRQRLESTLQQERDHLEETVSARTAQLASTNRELEAFSYSVSHDLRAPLRAIDGFSLALLEDYGNRLDETGRDYLKRVRNGAQKMGLLIDDLLQLSRVTRSELKGQQVDLSGLAAEIVEELQQSEPGRQIQITIAPGLQVWGDSTLLRVLLANLLGNAWKFTRHQAIPTIEFGRVAEPHEPAFFIRDNGAGFDMQYAHKLFVAFQRLHGVEQFEGTGIGLATVQRVISKHGGRIWAEAGIDKGATFYFTLPGKTTTGEVEREEQQTV